MSTSRFSTGEDNGDLFITNARLADLDDGQTWDILCQEGQVRRITESKLGLDEPSVSRVDAEGGLLLPSFCHAHVHLDKCFILDKCGPLVTGDFSEAMRVTSAAKAEFKQEDLYERGAKLIRESVGYGVTSMRAHVEVDSVVGFTCLEAGLRLQEDFKDVCDVQIAVFAQEPLFADAGENAHLFREAAGRTGVAVIGSAPYVEATTEQAKMNIGLVFDIVDAHPDLSVDFHLDYNLDPASEPLVYDVISQAAKRHPCPRITIGHATRLQLFSRQEWEALIRSITDLPFTFVGLPQSDLYMQGRTHIHEPLGAPRGTLRIPYLKKEHGINIAMSVNNVQNAFTPQGSLDPLALCTLGVAIFQSATPEDLRTLVRSVTLTPTNTITSAPVDLAPRMGDRADFVILHGRQSLQSAVLDPPFDRTTIKAGRVVASKRSTNWIR